MDNRPDMQKLITKIGVDAYKFYKSITKAKNKHFKDGAVIIPAYFENKIDSALETYITQDVKQKAKDVELDFGYRTRRKMVAYDDGIFIDAAKMMTNFTSFLKTKKVVFEQQKIKSFDEIEGRYIINCSGVGGAELNQDKNVIPVQGHLVMLKDQNPADLQRMILVYFGKSVTKYGQTVKRSFYMFPKRLESAAKNDVGVLGGTFIEGATADTPNNKEFTVMIKGAKRFYGLKE